MIVGLLEHLKDLYCVLSIVDVAQFAFEMANSQMFEVLLGQTGVDIGLLLEGGHQLGLRVEVFFYKEVLEVPCKKNLRVVEGYLEGSVPEKSFSELLLLPIEGLKGARVLEILQLFVELPQLAPHVVLDHADLQLQLHHSPPLRVLLQRAQTIFKHQDSHSAALSSTEFLDTLRKIIPGRGDVRVDKFDRLLSADISVILFEPPQIEEEGFFFGGEGVLGEQDLLDGSGSGLELSQIRKKMLKEQQEIHFLSFDGRLSPDFGLLQIFFGYRDCSSRLRISLMRYLYFSLTWLIQASICLLRTTSLASRSETDSRATEILGMGWFYFYLKEGLGLTELSLMYFMKSGYYYLRGIWSLRTMVPASGLSQTISPQEKSPEMCSMIVPESFFTKSSLIDYFIFDVILALYSTSGLSLPLDLSFINGSESSWRALGLQSGLQVRHFLTKLLNQAEQSSGEERPLGGVCLIWNMARKG